jgi:hypothetical protein
VLDLLTGVGAIRLFFDLLSSWSDSPDVRLPSTLPDTELAALTADIGVIGGVDSGKAEFSAVTLGTVPIVGAGEPADLYSCDA